MRGIKFSIKLKVTLWYTFFDLLIVGIIFILLIKGSQSNLLGGYQKTLINTVENAAEDVEYEDGKLEIDIEHEDYPSNIRILVYTLNGEKVYGSLPYGFIEKIPFSVEEIKRENTGEKEWYVYDTYTDNNEEQVYWVRGILSIDSSTIAISSIIGTAFILLPLLVLLAAVGGYIVTKHAFKPIDNLNHAIASIDSGNDLYKRIPYKGAKDEIYTLTQNFNEMFIRLEEAFTREKQFTSDASHELRTPIAVIKAECEYGLMQKENPLEMQSSLESILRQSQTMSALVNQLLMLARADKGTVQLSKETFNLCELVEMVVESLEEEAEEKQIKLYIFRQEDIAFYGDQTLMMRLFINLVSNGIYYGNAEGYVKIRLEETEHQIIAYIEDNGIGIAKVHQGKIWNRFYQVDPSRSKFRAGSSGLGLAMVKWIVEMHQGNITLESEEGKGSTFKIVLPKFKG